MLGPPESGVMVSRYSHCRRPGLSRLQSLYCAPRFATRSFRAQLSEIDHEAPASQLKSPMKNAPSVQTFRLQSDDRANCRPQLTAWDAQSLTTGQVPQINDKIGLFFFLRLALSERY